MGRPCLVLPLVKTPTGKSERVLFARSKQGAWGVLRERDERHFADQWNPLFDPAAGRVEETCLYYLLDDAGEVRSTYASGTSSLEDDLYLWGHAVVGDQLLRYASTHDSDRGTASYEVRGALQALRPVARDASSLAPSCARS